MTHCRFVERLRRVILAIARRIACLLAVSALGAVTPVAAEQMPWKEEQVSYVANGKDLREFLREFAVSQGVAAWIDPEVRGKLTDRYEVSPAAMMEILSRQFGLIWYFDGSALFVYPSSAVESATLRLGAGLLEFERQLRSLGHYDPRYPLKVDRKRGVVFASGPRRYIELVKQTAQLADPGSGPDVDTVVRTFPLKYAFAGDYSFTQGGKEFRVPGVVSLLRQLYPPRATGASEADVQLAGARGEPTTRMRGTNLDVRVPPSVADFQGLANSMMPSGGRDRGLALPSFAADPRTNAVLIRDIPGRIGTYLPLIQSLDEKPSIIEIEVNILEVSADDLATLGVDWRSRSARTEVQSGGGLLTDPITSPRGFNGAPIPNGTQQSADQGVGNVLGGVLSTVIGDRQALLLRVSALEQKGQASVRSQPKVMTLNNVEAVLESRSTFYVRVAGFQDAQLADVSVGTSIRVTPAVSSESGSPATMRLLVKINDGSVSEAQVDQIPVVQNTTISTQALIEDGASLLIGGYSQEREKKSKSGVPWLSGIPLLGKLFSTSSEGASKVARLFLITPRISRKEATEFLDLKLIPEP
jgi:type III secretion protein C